MDTHAVTVGTFNIRELGWTKGRGHVYLSDALDFLLEQTPTPPDILAFPEAAKCLDDGQHALRSGLVYPLSQQLDNGWYEPFYASQGLPGHHNHYHLLLVNNTKVKPLAWYDPSIAHGNSRRLAGFLHANILGHQVNICCEHWPGGEGRAEFDRAVERVSTLGGTKNKTILLGDFNATSSWEREYLPDWYAVCSERDELHKLKQKGWKNPATGKWEVDTRQIDDLRTIHGYRDMGEEFGDPTPTTHPDEGSGLRIDRIFCSAGLPATVLDYSVRQPPLLLSDHAYVFGTYSVAAVPDELVGH